MCNKERMNKTILFFIWMIFLFAILSECYDLINKSSNMANIAGITGLFAFALLSVKTKCFTSITIKSKKNESNEK